MYDDKLEDLPSKKKVVVALVPDQIKESTTDIKADVEPQKETQEPEKPETIKEEDDDYEENDDDLINEIYNMN